MLLTIPLFDVSLAHRTKNMPIKTKKRKRNTKDDDEDEEINNTH